MFALSCVGMEIMLFGCFNGRSVIKGKVNARECIEKGFRMMKDKIIAEVGPYFVDNSENIGGSSYIKNSVGRRAKSERNIRKKSVVERKYNKVKRKRKSALTYASRIKMAIQLYMNNEVLGRVVNAPTTKKGFYSGNHRRSTNFRVSSFFYKSNKNLEGKFAAKIDDKVLMVYPVGVSGLTFIGNEINLLAALPTEVSNSLVGKCVTYGVADGYSVCNS
ncbi:hypothetical protein M9H77_17347 [Catharanthus roseus]|uniref:Uncharacterized protein n=1 Tax=Catharanthus roseus TaxID=4058 RepID=A0ACC0B4C5_CATRO|nr:hypothetical protein M9H77_17347 [Catharanthus roseus]